MTARRSLCLAPTQLARLHLGLGYPLPEWFSTFLSDSDRLGCLYELDQVGGSIGLFEPERLLDEALLFEPGVSLGRNGFFPIGACGGGGRTVFMLQLSPNRGDFLFAWHPGEAEPRPLPQRLSQLRATVGSSAQLRRRLPRPIVKAQPKKPKRSKQLRKTRPSAAERTLNLFDGLAI